MSNTINIKEYDEAVDKIYALEKQVRELEQQLAYEEDKTKIILDGYAGSHPHEKNPPSEVSDNE